MTALVIGAVIAVAFVIGVRALPRDRANTVYVVGLIVTALLYVFFAVAHGASSTSLAIEFLGALIYVALAIAGLRGNRLALAIGWAGHPVWDVLLHTSGRGAEYTPSWYPLACIGFDLVVAIAILTMPRSQVSRTSHEHPDT